MICFAGRRLAVLATPPQPWSGVLELHPCFRTGDPGYCSYTNSAWSEQRELNSRHRVGGPRHQPLYHARSSKPVAVATGVEPVPPDRQSGILPIDSATASNLAEEA